MMFRYHCCQSFVYVVFAGEPISCWIPEEFTSSWAHYANAICWVNSTYYLPFDEEIPGENEPRKVIGYYQWTSLILACMAVLFYVPRVVWATFNKKSGIEVTTLTGAAIECQHKTDPADREKTLRYMIKHMGRFLGEVRGKLYMSSKLQNIWWRAYGTYLATLYLVIKLAFILNCVAQLILLDHMLGLRDHLHGLNFIQRLLFSEEGVESPLFPRVAMCDFKIRALGNVRRYTIQCSLPINLFNEKIFISVWFWLVFVAAASVFSFLQWFWYALYYGQHVNYVKTRLITMGKIGENRERDRIDIFVREFMRRDGVFLIYLISVNSSDLIASEVVVGLWDHYWGPRVRDKINNHDDTTLQLNIPPSKGS